MSSGGASALDLALAAATTAGGLAAGIGAAAAWLTARASRQTSRDALAALGVGIRPTVSVDITRITGGIGLVARFYNGVSDFHAREVELEVRLRTGETWSMTRPRLRRRISLTG
jgi:hypothetical protein